MHGLEHHKVVLEVGSTLYLSLSVYGCLCLCFCLLVSLLTWLHTLPSTKDREIKKIYMLNSLFERSKQMNITSPDLPHTY